MHFSVLVLCLSSFFVNASNGDIPPEPVEVIHAGPTKDFDVFCLFAFSNWNKLSDIHGIFPSARRVGIARLPYHRIDFKVYSVADQGCLPTIVPDCGYEVWGAIYYIPMKDLPLVLTKGGLVNNVRASHFVQNTVEAYFYGETTAENLKCNSYQQIDLPEKLIYGLPIPEDRRPSKKIRDVLMVESFKDAGLPDEYIKQVSQLPIREQGATMCSQTNHN